MAWWIWIVLGAVLLSAEVVLAADFYLVFFGVAAILLGLLGVSGAVLPAWVQFLLFAALAVTGLVFYRARWKRRLLVADREIGPELVGEAGVASESIAPGGRGAIQLRGSRWNARNEGSAEIAEGGRCRVVGVDGLTLHVRSDG